MIKISPSQHVAWQQQHRRNQRQIPAYHRLNQQPQGFKQILKGAMKDGTK